MLGKMSLFKILAVTGSTQDEELLRRAQRMEEDRIDACAELRARMAKNAVYCKQALAQTKKVGQQIASNLIKIEQSVKNSVKSQNNFLELRKNQAAQEELEKHKEGWDDAIHEWLAKASGQNPMDNNDNPHTLALAKLLADYLEKGEPGQAKHSTAVITYHPFEHISVSLKVAYACGDVGLETGQTLRRTQKESSPLTSAIWDVLENGSPVLANPYNHPEVAQSAVSIVPLVAMNQHRFAVVVSGAPAVPDEFIDTFASTAGQMFERIGKLEIVWRIIANVQTFIEKQCVAAGKLVHVTFSKSGEVATDDSPWAWQPLDYTHPTNEKRFELGLQWDGGEKIGLFSVECSTFTPMDEQLIVLLHTIAQMLIDAVNDVEELELGHKPPLYTATQVMDEYENRRELIAEKLAAELARSVKLSLTFHNSIVETASYCAKVDDADTQKLMQALLTLAGLPCSSWQEVRKSLKSARNLVEALADVGMLADSISHAASLASAAMDVGEVVLGSASEALTAKKDKKAKKASKKAKKVGRKNATKWNVAEAYIKDVDLIMLSQKSPVPVRIIIRWIRAARIVYNIGVAMATPKDEGKNPLAQKVFDTIDSNGDGLLSTDEIITHLVSEYGADPTMRLLRVIDSNADGVVSVDEWHRAWRNGDFDVEIGDDVEEEKDSARPKVRILSRHFSQGSRINKARPIDPRLANAPSSAQEASKVRRKSKDGKVEAGKASRTEAPVPDDSDDGKKEKSKKKSRKEKESKVAPAGASAEAPSSS